VKLYNHKTIFGVLLCILLFCLKINTTFAVTAPYFSLSSDSGQYYSSCGDFYVDILINTGTSNSDSANIIINYDPSILEIQDSNVGVSGIQISEGTAYNNYSGNTVNDTEGTILLTGFNVGSPLNTNNNPELFGRIYFQTLSTTGTVDLNIDFALGETLDSNIAETITSDDILLSVGDLTLQIIDDSSAPTTQSSSPSNGQSDVAINSNISITLSDIGCGVDYSSIEIIADNIAYTQSGDNVFVQSGTINNPTFTINPDYSFDYGETINVSISGEDVNNNIFNNNFSFNVINDNSAPQISNLNPSNNVTGVSITSNISFTISDSVSGVNLSSFSFLFDGQTYDSSSNLFNITGNSSFYNFTFNPSSNFDYGEAVSFQITATDFNNNILVNTFRFTAINDNTPLYVSNFSPANLSTDIAVNSNISFYLIDDISGVDLSTFFFIINDVSYDQNDSELTITGNSLNYSVIFNPPSDFSRGEIVEIIINADDLNRNSMSPANYTFTTIENQTPMLDAIGDKTVSTGNLLTFLLTGEDQDNDNVTITISGENLPDSVFLTGINSQTKIFSWTPSQSEIGEYEITATITDDGSLPSNLMDNETFMITVQGEIAENHYPIWTNIENKEITQDDNSTFVVLASDQDDDDLTLTLTDDANLNINFEDLENGSGVLTINTTDTEVGEYTITLTATDNGSPNLSTTLDINIEIIEAIICAEIPLPEPSSNENLAPIWTTITKQTVSQGDTLFFTIVASDSNDDDLSLQLLNNDDLDISFEDLGNGTGVIEIDTLTEEQGDYTVSFSATDAGAPNLLANLNVNIEITEPGPECNITQIISGGGGGIPQQIVVEKIIKKNIIVQNIIKEEIIKLINPIITQDNKKESLITKINICEPEMKYITVASETATIFPNTYNEQKSTGGNTPPYIENLNPKIAEKNVNIDTDIYLEIVDFDEINKDSIELLVNNEKVEAQIEGTNIRYQVKFKPQKSFNYNEEIIVSVSAEDKHPTNAKSISYNYNFHTESQAIKVPVSDKSIKLIDLEALLDIKNYSPYLNVKTKSRNLVRVKWKNKTDEVEVLYFMTKDELQIPAPLLFDSGNYEVEAQAIDKKDENLKSELIKIPFYIPKDNVINDTLYYGANLSNLFKVQGIPTTLCNFLSPKIVYGLFVIFLILIQLAFWIKKVHIRNFAALLSIIIFIIINIVLSQCNLIKYYFWLFSIISILILLEFLILRIFKYKK